MYRRFPPLAALSLLLLLPSGGAAAAEPQTDAQKTLYALGLVISQRMTDFSLTPAEVEMVQAGMADGLLGRDPKVKLDEYGPRIDELRQERMTTAASREKEASREFIDAVAKEPGAVRTDSGLIYQEQEAGTGVHPTAADTVRVHYKGTLRDGKVFDSSLEKGEPVSFSLGEVIPCFREGLQLMKVGGKGKVTCPSDLAYGDRGVPGVIPPAATLIFEMQLLEVIPPVPAP